MDAGSTSLLLILSAPLVVVPGPNVPGFYFTFQVVGHFLSMARREARAVRSRSGRSSRATDLAELRAGDALARRRSAAALRELAARLRLEHLATFFEDVAAPTA